MDLGNLNNLTNNLVSMNDLNDFNEETNNLSYVSKEYNTAVTEKTIKDDDHLMVAD